MDSDPSDRYEGYPSGAELIVPNNLSHSNSKKAHSGNILDIFPLPCYNKPFNAKRRFFFISRPPIRAVIFKVHILATCSGHYVRWTNTQLPMQSVETISSLRSGARLLSNTPKATATTPYTVWITTLRFISLKATTPPLSRIRTYSSPLTTTTLSS